MIETLANGGIAEESTQTGVPGILVKARGADTLAGTSKMIQRCTVKLLQNQEVWDAEHV